MGLHGAADVPFRPAVCGEPPQARAQNAGDAGHGFRWVAGGGRAEETRLHDKGNGGQKRVEGGARDGRRVEDVEAKSVSGGSGCRSVYWRGGVEVATNTAVGPMVMVAVVFGWGLEADVTRRASACSSSSTVCYSHAVSRPAPMRVVLKWAHCGRSRIPTAKPNSQRPTAGQHRIWGHVRRNFYTHVPLLQVGTGVSMWGCRCRGVGV